MRSELVDKWFQRAYLANGRVSLIKLLATYEIQHYESRRRHACSLSSKVHVEHAS
jgi:hypothetical protein